MILYASLLALLFAFPWSALAVEEYPPIICTGLFGCGQGAANVLTESTLPAAASLLVQLAAGGAILAVTVAGVQMVTSYGDDAKISNARMGILYALGGLGLALCATSIVSFVSTEDYGFLDGEGDVVSVMSSIIGIIMTLFNVAFAIVIILAGLRMITAQGNAEEFKKGGSMIKWAIIGAVIVNAAKALVQAVLMLNL